MTHFEEASAIANYLLKLMGTQMVYKPDDYRPIDSAIENIKASNDYFDIDLTKLSEQELIELRFSLWDKESKNYLIPLWIFPFLTEVLTVTDINGKTETLSKSKLDLDNRFGYLAYGVIPTNAN